jgi:hypothetical protein
MKVYLEGVRQNRRLELRATSVIMQLAVSLPEVRTYVAWQADGQLKYVNQSHKLALKPKTAVTICALRGAHCDYPST